MAGMFALIWLVLRSGTKPSRLAYPCQQAAFGTAAAAFGAPAVATVVSLRGRIGAILKTGAGRVAAGSLCAVTLVVLAFASVGMDPEVVILDPPAGHFPDVYLVNEARGIEPGRYGGVDDLVTLMGINGLKWHRSSETGETHGPDGLIDHDDVVLIKVNAQWSQRGGTNTDVLRGVIRRVVEHPDGFAGEIVVADNSQGFGNWPTNLDRAESNAEDHSQSAQDVVDDFVAEGWSVSTYLWDGIRGDSVAEYALGDMRDGYVLGSVEDPETAIKVSYPKFRSTYGTYMSYRYGVWSPASQTYDPGRLVVINMPVFKTHSIYAITASVKNHMGVVTTALYTDSHNAVGRGGMGSVLAEARMPDLTILDCIWILARPGMGPSASYENASRRDQLVAGTDPIALDVWATKFIMIPQIIENGYPYTAYSATQDPDNPGSKFRVYLDRSMNEVLLAGIPATNDVNAVSLHLWPGDLDQSGAIDGADYVELEACLAGPGEAAPTDCDLADFDGDGSVDLSEFATFQRVFTGAGE
jgi:uncharacterized protein (DUF362 family)